MIEERHNTVNVNFRFPTGCKEEYSCAEMPVLPRPGDYIEGSKPQSGRYLVKAVVFAIDQERERCEAIRIELEALDQVSPIR